jgi:hypothetical protein
MSGRSLFPACLAAALTVSLGGCAIVGERYVLEEPFTDAHVRTIRHGETTKKEVLGRLGPPAFLDNAVGRFPAAQGKAGIPLVYGYRDSAITFVDFCAYGQGGGGCFNTAPTLKMRTLWILIDEETQRVVDHFLEETESEAVEQGVAPWLR